MKYVPEVTTLDAVKNIIDTGAVVLVIFTYSLGVAENVTVYCVDPLRFEPRPVVAAEFKGPIDWGCIRNSSGVYEPLSLYWIKYVSRDKPKRKAWLLSLYDRIPAEHRDRFPGL